MKIVELGLQPRKLVLQEAVRRLQLVETIFNGVDDVAGYIVVPDMAVKSIQESS